MLGNGTVVLADLNTSFGGNDNAILYTDTTGSSWTLQTPQTLSDVHGPSSPPIVEGALTHDDVTYLFYKDYVYELEPNNPLGTIVAVYGIWEEIPRNIFVNAPKGITGASEDYTYPLARMYRGFRWIYYNMATSSILINSHGEMIP